MRPLGVNTFHAAKAVTALKKARISDFREKTDKKFWGFAENV